MSLVETNLTPEIADNELGLVDFTIYRCDRSFDTSHKSSGGGTLIAIRNSIPCRQIIPSSINIECLFVLCKLSTSSSVLIGNVYIPPDKPSSIYATFCDAVDEVMNSIKDPVHVYIMGDFNQPGTIWKESDISTMTLSARYLYNTLTSYGLKQVNSISNYRGVCLDLVFSSDEDLVTRNADELLLDEERHHPALIFDFEVFMHSSPPTYVSFPDYRRCNAAAVFTNLASLTYPSKEQLSEIEDVFNDFSYFIGASIEAHTPVKKVTNTNFPPWFSGSLKKLVIRKKILHKQFKSSLSHADYVRFCAARRNCKTLTQQCHANYINTIEDTIPSNIKSFWSYINSLKHASSLPPTMFLDTAEASDAKAKCNLFAQHFSSVFEVRDVPAPAIDHTLNTQSISRITFSALDVQHKLEALDSNKGPGPDGIPPAILKYCAVVLAPHLTILFRKLITEGIFPSILKQSYVVPIFKAGSKSNVRNYRPIAIQSVLAKIFESLALDCLQFQLRKEIIPEQHGFLRGRSSTTNLLVFQNYIMSSFVESF